MRLKNALRSRGTMFSKIQRFMQPMKQWVVRLLIVQMVVPMPVTWNMPTYAAGIEVDPNQANLPSLDHAPNGVDIVHLSQPNGRGMSSNKFREYNVPQTGIIMNKLPGLIR